MDYKLIDDTSDTFTCVVNGKVYIVERRGSAYMTDEINTSDNFKVRLYEGIITARYPRGMKSYKTRELDPHEREAIIRLNFIHGSDRFQVISDRYVLAVLPQSAPGAGFMIYLLKIAKFKPQHLGCYSLESPLEEAVMQQLVKYPKIVYDFDNKVSFVDLPNTCSVQFTVGEEDLVEELYCCFLQSRINRSKKRSSDPAKYGNL